MCQEQIRHLVTVGKNEYMEPYSACEKAVWVCVRVGGISLGLEKKSVAWAKFWNMSGSYPSGKEKKKTQHSRKR